MHIYLWTIYSCSSLRGAQASQEDVRIQDGEEIAAWVEDSLAHLCKMLPEKADIHVQQVGLLCTGKLRSSFIRFFFRIFPVTYKLSSLVFHRLLSFSFSHSPLLL